MAVITRWVDIAWGEAGGAEWPIRSYFLGSERADIVNDPAQWSAAVLGSCLGSGGAPTPPFDPADGLIAVS